MMDLFAIHRCRQKEKGDKAEKSENERTTDTRYGSENQTKKNELARTGIEPIAFR